MFASRVQPPAFRSDESESQGDPRRRRPAKRVDLAPSERRSAPRVLVRGASYRSTIDEAPVVLLDLSTTGAQITSAARLRPSQTIVFRIGLSEQPWATALARVQWVDPQPASGEGDAGCRIGVAFEVWDVPTFKGIVERYRWASAH